MDSDANGDCSHCNTNLSTKISHISYALVGTVIRYLLLMKVLS